MVDMSTRAYGGIGADERIRARRSQLIDAALGIMAGNEWRAATVAKVCHAAGLNKRYFYESFTDLDSLAAAVVEDTARGVAESSVAAFLASAGSPLRDRAFQSIDAAVRALVEDPRRARVLFDAVAASPAVLAHRVLVVQGLTGVLVAHAREIHDVELETDTLARVAPAFLVGGTAEAILGWLNGNVDVSLDELIDDLTTLWLITG
ncbi:MAG: transcriptional regulator, partial [Mycobacterium sp.]|nr:transcriptional regulator [Mycobacterium sp.]